MKKALVIIALAAAGLSLAYAAVPKPEPLAVPGTADFRPTVDVQVHIKPGPCREGLVLNRIEAAFHKYWREATVDVPGMKGVGACWTIDPDTDTVFVVDALGYDGHISKDRFKAPGPKPLTIDKR